MKKLFVFLLLAVLLTGCHESETDQQDATQTTAPIVTTVPDDNTQPTEPTALEYKLSFSAEQLIVVKEQLYITDNTALYQVNKDNGTYIKAADLDPKHAELYADDFGIYYYIPDAHERFTAAGACKTVG